MSKVKSTPRASTSVYYLPLLILIALLFYLHKMKKHNAFLQEGVLFNPLATPGQRKSLCTKFNKENENPLGLGPNGQ